MAWETRSSVYASPLAQTKENLNYGCYKRCSKPKVTVMLPVMRAIQRMWGMLWNISVLYNPGKTNSAQTFTTSFQKADKKSKSRDINNDHITELHYVLFVVNYFMF